MFWSWQGFFWANPPFVSFLCHKVKIDHKEKHNFYLGLVGLFSLFTFGKKKPFKPLRSKSTDEQYCVISTKGSSLPLTNLSPQLVNRVSPQSCIAQSWQKLFTRKCFQVLFAVQLSTALTLLWFITCKLYCFSTTSLQNYLWKQEMCLITS